MSSVGGAGSSKVSTQMSSSGVNSSSVQGLVRERELVSSVRETVFKRPISAVSSSSLTDRAQDSSVEVLKRPKSMYRSILGVPLLIPSYSRVDPAPYIEKQEAVVTSFSKIVDGLSNDQLGPDQYDQKLKEMAQLLTEYVEISAEFKRLCFIDSKVLGDRVREFLADGSNVGDKKKLYHQIFSLIEFQAIGENGNRLEKLILFYIKFRSFFENFNFFSRLSLNLSEIFDKTKSLNDDKVKVIEVLCKYSFIDYFNLFRHALDHHHQELIDFIYKLPNHIEIVYKVADKDVHYMKKIFHTGYPFKAKFFRSPLKSEFLICQQRLRALNEFFRERKQVVFDELSMEKYIQDAEKARDLDRVAFYINHPARFPVCGGHDKLLKDICEFAGIALNFEDLNSSDLFELYQKYVSEHKKVTKSKHIQIRKSKK